MKNIIFKITLFCAFLIFPSCELDEVKNPNNPTIGSVEDGASQADVQLLAIGLEAVMRNDLEYHYDTVSILAREYYDLTGVDPRYTGELLKGPLDNNGFLTTRAFAAWYRVVKSANVLITAVTNSSAGFSNQVKNSYFGYAKTLKAYALFILANRQGSNGIRLDVEDPDNLGPFVGYDPALVAIMDLLNEGLNDLGNSDNVFDFALSSGFDDLRKLDPSTGGLFPLTPADFSEFNRALAARVALYQGNKPLALNMLDDSFFDLNGNLNKGVAHVFGLSGNDIANEQYHVPNNSGDVFMINDSWIDGAEPGDSRVTNKSHLYESGDPLEPTTVEFDGLFADYQIALYDSNVDPVYLIRNEELILIYAEAQIGTDNTAAMDAINIVRNAAGIGSYTGATDDNSLLEEVLQQRKYSLFAEGHRWMDLRRLDRLNENYIPPTGRLGDNIISEFPTPFNEGL